MYMQTTYIFGHKVPDTDSVCSSISLAYLKNKLGLKAEPRVLGSLNKESKFVLDYFNIEEPQYLNDVKVQIKDMKYNSDAMIEEHVSIYDTYNTLVSNGVTGLPLVDKDKQLKGYINVKEISRHLIEGDITYLNTSYDNILKTLDAKEIIKIDEEIEGNILAAAYRSESFISNVELIENNILIVGDRFKIIEYALKSKIKLLILVNNTQLPDDLIKIAKKNKVNVITSSYGTYKCANMIKLCNYIKLININPNPTTFNVYDYRNDFIKVTNKLGFTNYPIVNKQNMCLGMIRLVDTNNYEKQQVILVDHNQQSQTVDGIEEADIIEVVDHHNLGTIGTTLPINFRSMPVGCTCTVVYKLYKESNVDIPKDIAGIMLSAILSDTLIFQSPTTTDLDKEVAENLAEIAGIDIEKYSLEMFRAASSIAGMSMEEIINIDIKSFKYEKYDVAIDQVMTMDLDELLNKQDELIKELNKKCEVENYDMALVFVTDIIKNGSYLFFNENVEEMLEDAFGIKDIKQGVYLDGVVSRKKQMLPPILEMLERRS